MKKIDIETKISEYLSRRPLIFLDLFGVTYNISSYENFMYSFSLTKNTFSESISEFYEEANKYVERMNNYVETVMANCSDDSIDNYISNNLRSALGGGSWSDNRTIELIVPESFTFETEKSEKTIKQIYSELGYRSLREYLNLLKTPSQLSNYLSASDKQKQLVGIKYMLYVTDHHSPSNYKRDKSAKTLYKETHQNIQNALAEIERTKEKFVGYMNSQINTTDEWFQESRDKHDDLMKTFELKTEKLVDAYRNKLKISEPSAYMEEKANEYHEKAKDWTVRSVCVSIVLLIILLCLLSPSIDLNGNVVNISFFNSKLPLHGSVVLITMILVVVYVLKTFIQIAISSKHLEEEYHQKHILTYFYLSLISETTVSPETKNAILLSLFSKSDTGLIKNDSTLDVLEIVKSATPKK